MGQKIYLMDDPKGILDFELEYILPRSAVRALAEYWYANTCKDNLVEFIQRVAQYAVRLQSEKEQACDHDWIGLV
uniref:Uncharacterized protein n=1 Tax=viral metagenome TaxID=1070528 RepID=A0A6H1Z9W6_9ZZZZ